MKKSYLEWLGRLVVAAWFSLGTSVSAGDTEHWSMGPLGGTFQTVPGTNMLAVKSVPAGTPADSAGLLVNDHTIGAYGGNFRPISSFYQFHRTANPNTLACFGGRGNNGGDSYLNFDHVTLYNPAFAMAVFNGGLPFVPGVMRQSPGSN